MLSLGTFRKNASKLSGKTWHQVFLLALLLIISSCDNATPNASSEFMVWGNCNMCKSTIEKSLDVKGVSTADWNKDSKLIAVAYDTTLISLPQLHQLIALSGYDTELEKGDDAAYKELPECCQYQRK